MKKILPLADGADEGLRQAALFALANIGDPAAGPVLSRSRVAAPYRERSAAPSLYLLYARRLAESGRTTEALAAARAVLDNYRRPEESQHASAALALVVSTLGARALPDLLAAADSPDRSFRGSALALAETIPGTEATLRWVEKAGASPSDVRADILAMLGQREDAAALPFVRESLRSADETVRLAAIPAATRLGGEAVLPDLLPLLGSADADESAALKTALLGYPGPLVVPEAVRLLDATPLPAKAVLIDVLGEKGARGEIERVYRLAEDPDPAIREASLAALGQLAGDADLPRLVAMLEKASASDDVVRLQEAIAAAVLPEPGPRAEGRRPPRPAEERDARRDDRDPEGPAADRRDEAAPCDRGRDREPGPRGPVRRRSGASPGGPTTRRPRSSCASPRRTQDREQFRAAVQGYVRLVGRSNTPAVKKLAAYEKLLALPGEDADKKPVLAGMAAVREPESLRLLARYLDDPARRDAAAAALLDLASRQSPEEPWLSGHEAYSVLRRVEASLADPAAKERAGKDHRRAPAPGRLRARSSTAALSRAGRASSPTRPRGRR